MPESIPIIQMVLVGVSAVGFGLAMWILSNVSGRINKVEQAINSILTKCESHAERITFVEAKVNGRKSR